MKKFILVFISAISQHVIANNIQLSNISVINNANNTGKVIQFDLSWQNSWRDSASSGNYDGPGCFLK
jgi:hypothetical protein